MRNVSKNQAMQDPLENRLSKLPLQRAPAHWKTAILKQAAPAIPPKQVPWNWMSLAAAWALIGLLQWQTYEPSTPNTGDHTSPIYIQSLSTLRSPEVYLEELLADPSPIQIAPRQSRYTPKATAALA